jgi:hypothetical protein
MRNLLPIFFSLLYPLVPFANPRKYIPPFEQKICNELLQSPETTHSQVAIANLVGHKSIIGNGVVASLRSFLPEGHLNTSKIPDNANLRDDLVKELPNTPVQDCQVSFQYSPGDSLKSAHVEVTWWIDRTPVQRLSISDKQENEPTILGIQKIPNGITVNVTARWVSSILRDGEPRISRYQLSLEINTLGQIETIGAYSMSADIEGNFSNFGGWRSNLCVLN